MALAFLRLGASLRGSAPASGMLRYAANPEKVIGGIVTNCPASFATYLDRVARKEKRADAVVARHLILSVPHELDDEGRQRFAFAFCEREFGTPGHYYAFSVHRPHGDGEREADTRAYHAHIIATTRPALTDDELAAPGQLWGRSQASRDMFRRGWVRECKGRLVEQLREHGLEPTRHRIPQHHIGPRYRGRTSSGVQRLREKREQYNRDPLPGLSYDRAADLMALAWERQRIPRREVAELWQYREELAEQMADVRRAFDAADKLTIWEQLAVCLVESWAGARAAQEYEKTIAREKSEAIDHAKQKAAAARKDVVRAQERLPDVSLFPRPRAGRVSSVTHRGSKSKEEPEI